MSAISTVILPVTQQSSTTGIVPNRWECDIRNKWKIRWVAYDTVFDFRLNAKAVCISNC